MGREAARRDSEMAKGGERKRRGVEVFGYDEEKGENLGKRCFCEIGRAHV